MNKVVLNKGFEPRFQVWNGSVWLKFVVSKNKTYHKDSKKDFWLVTEQETKKEHKLMVDKAEELYEKKQLII